MNHINFPSTFQAPAGFNTNNTFPQYPRVPGVNVPSQAEEKCLICNQPCGMNRIFIDFDRNRNCAVYACSLACQNTWNTLVQQTQQQHQQYNMMPMMTSNVPTSYYQNPSAINNQYNNSASLQQMQQQQQILFLQAQQLLNNQSSAPMNNNNNINNLSQFQSANQQQSLPQLYPGGSGNHNQPSSSARKSPPRTEGSGTKRHDSSNEDHHHRSNNKKLRTDTKQPSSTIARKSSVSPPSSPSKKNTTPASNYIITSSDNKTTEVVSLNDNNTNLPQQTRQPSSPKEAHEDSAVEEGKAPVLPVQAKNQTITEPLFVVVDTNILLEHLFELLNFRNHEHITIVVPMIVIHELDGLKKSDDASVANRSRSALKVMHESLQANQTLIKKWLRGQASHETVSNDSLLMLNNDDQVLNCALYYNKFVAQGRVLLLTADTGLGVKAMMQQLPVSNFTAFLTTLPPVYTGSEHYQQQQKQLQQAHNNIVSSSSSPSRDQSHNPSVQIITLEQQQREIPPFGLSADLWTRILSFIPPRNLAPLGEVNYSFYQLLNANDKVWRESINRTFNDTTGVLIPSYMSAKEWYIKWRRQTLTISSKNI